jgi:hypothetical protein
MIDYEVFLNKKQWLSHKEHVNKRHSSDVRYPDEYDIRSNFIPEFPCIMVYSWYYDHRFAEDVLQVQFLTRENLQEFIDVARKMDIREKIGK